MNKRIKELAQQAFDKSIHPGELDLERFSEKFAELIVQECAEVAGCNGHVSGFTLGDLIKQHFGVES